MSILWFTVVILSASVTAFEHSPIVIIPGFGGNQLDVRVDKKSLISPKKLDLNEDELSLYVRCSRSDGGWSTIWLDAFCTTRFGDSYTLEYTRLYYDRKSRTTSSEKGVHIKVSGFGNTTTVEFLDPYYTRGYSVYMNTLVEDLVHTMGYTRFLTLLGAPYDWRKSPLEHEDYFRDLKMLIQDTYDTFEKKVIVFGHSMGGLYSLLFLNRMTSAWKEKYISGLITVGTPWGGCVKPLKMLTYGDDLGYSVLFNHNDVGQVVSTFPSTVYMLPKHLGWSGKEVLVETPKRNYTSYELPQIFLALNLSDQYEMWKDIQQIPALKHPGVPFHCIHGTGLITLSKIKFKTMGDIPNNPTLIEDQGLQAGDGTVNYRSLRACEYFENRKKGLIVKRKELVGPGMDHMGMLQDKNFIKYFKSIITKPLK